MSSIRPSTASSTSTITITTTPVGRPQKMNTSTAIVVAAILSALRCA
jgi:hypothetical protein